MAYEVEEQIPCVFIPKYIAVVGRIVGDSNFERLLFQVSGFAGGS